MIVERGPTAILRYDAAENILYYAFPNVTLETPEQIVTHFDWCMSFWRRHCGGRKVYCVVDLDGVHVNARHTNLYAAQLRRTLDFAITIVRHGGSSLQRTAVRIAHMKLHTPSRIYGSQEEALMVVKALKSGEIMLEPAGTR